MEHEPFTRGEDDGTLESTTEPASPDAAQPTPAAELAPELVEGVVVVEPVTMIEPVRAPALVQAAAAVATGFVAGAATAAVLGRRRTLRAASARRTLAVPGGPGRALGAPRLDAYRASGPTQTFLVQVQALSQRRS